MMSYEWRAEIKIARWLQYQVYIKAYGMDSAQQGVDIELGMFANNLDFEPG